MKYLPYVNIKMGTKSVKRRSYGNTLPLTQLPFGMASYCIQTGSEEGWFYHPDHEFAEGVRLTHQPSPWINDYGTFIMTPQNDVIADSAAQAWSGYRIQESVQRPDYLKLTFIRSNCTFELTPQNEAQRSDWSIMMRGLRCCRSYQQRVTTLTDSTVLRILYLVQPMAIARTLQ